MKRNHEGGSEQGDAKRVKITLESHREERVQLFEANGNEIKIG